MKRSVLGRLLLICMMAFFLISCESITKIQVSVGAKNLEFEFMKNAEDVDNIIIQNVRDQKFKFIINDKNAIIDIYDILSKGKIVDEKSDLSPDYTLTIYIKEEKVFKFNYVTGSFGSSLGNFYDDNGKIFNISNLLDKNIIDNFFLVRKEPENFRDTYYNYIISAMNKYNKLGTLNGKKITIDLNGDTEYRRFIFSNDVDIFIDRLLKSNFSAKVYDFDLPKSSDINLQIKTIGFNEYTYKCAYIFTNNLNGSKESYFLKAEYKNKEWIENFEEENEE